LDKGVGDGLENPIKIPVNIGIPVPQLADAVTLQPGRSTRVVRGHRRFGVSSTVQLDRELSFRTEEIEDEWAERMLAPELEGLELPGSKSFPEDPLGRYQVRPKAAGVIPS
jgi:hypothetical protein